MGSIVCIGCGESKIASSDNFYLNGGKLRTKCKECYKSDRRTGNSIGRPSGSLNKDKFKPEDEMINKLKLDIVNLNNMVGELYLMMDNIYVPKGQTAKVDRSVVCRIQSKYKPKIDDSN